MELQLHTAEHVIVDANAAAIGRVVRNLIDNTIRHAPARDGPCRVTVVDTDRPHVTIHDDGDGFSEEFAAHAFERWTHADPSRNRATGGTGLGLQIRAA